MTASTCINYYILYILYWTEKQELNVVISIVCKACHSTWCRALATIWHSPLLAADEWLFNTSSRLLKPRAFRVHHSFTRMPFGEGCSTSWRNFFWTVLLNFWSFSFWETRETFLGDLPGSLVPKHPGQGGLPFSKKWNTSNETMLKASWPTALVNQEVPLRDFDLITLHRIPLGSLWPLWPTFDTDTLPNLEDHKSECCQVLDVAKCAWCHWSFLAIVSTAGPAEWEVGVRDISMYRMWWQVQYLLPCRCPFQHSAAVALVLLHTSSGFHWVVKCGFIIDLRTSTHWKRETVSELPQLKSELAVLFQHLAQKRRYVVAPEGQAYHAWRRGTEEIGFRVISSSMPLRSAVLHTENVLLPALHLCWQVQQTRHLRFQQYFLKIPGRARLRRFGAWVRQ